MSQLEPRNPATPDDPRRSELPAPALARPLARLSALGQSVWVDFLSREALSGGEIARLIAQDSVVGATSNPTIFQQAMSRAGGYGEQRLALAADGVSDPRTIFWQLAERDIAAACDLFAPTWRASGGRDGYVSLEVDPRHAYDTLATYTEAMRIRAAVDRPNLMVKVPATTPGLAAVEDLIAAGRSVNVTLVFSLRRYADTAESYLRGLERLVADGGDPSSVASVASFFISRIDAAADERLQALGADERLRGRLGVANAKLAYEHYTRTFSGPRWETLADAGASPQRLLWASTATKNPAYPDTMYVEELIGPDTVSTMPEDLIRAFQDHGRPRPGLRSGLPEARRLLDELAFVGVDYDELTDVLEREGVRKFADSFDSLMESLRENQRALSPA